MKKPVGRPRKYGCARSAASVRLTPAMKDLLVARCAESGRSLSEEIEITLEKVFFPLGLPADEKTGAANSGENAT